MAIDILSIPSMLVEPERVFSSARRMISWERMRLGSVNIERTKCLKSFVRVRVEQDGNFQDELRALTARISLLATLDNNVEDVVDEDKVALNIDTDITD